MNMGDEVRKKPAKEKLYELAHNLLLRDEVKARCVFGMDKNVLNDFDDFDEFRSDKLALIECMGNLLTIAGVFLYSKFNQWRSETVENLADKEMPNALYLKRLLAGVQNTNTFFDQASSGLRVLRVLDGLYDTFDMNFNVIKYIIINSQIEAGYNSNKNKGLSKLIGFPYEESFCLTCDPRNSFKREKHCNLAEAFNIISTYRNDPNIKNTSEGDKYKYENIACNFEDVFTTMEFLERVKLELDGEGNVNFVETAEDGTEKRIPSYGVARVFETNEGKCSGVYKSGNDKLDDYIINFYLLENIEYDLNPDTINARIIFSYRAFDERDLVQVYFTEKEGFVPEDCEFDITREKSAVECFKKISGYLPGSRAASSFFRGMITSHYRYHNILAPSIVDAIDIFMDVKKRILKEFVENNETPFKEALESTFKTLEFALNKSFPNKWKDKIDELCKYIYNPENIYRRIIDWDTLMAKILIYEGPSEIIRTILLHENTYSSTNNQIDKYSLDDYKKIGEICKQIIAGLEMRYIDNIFDANKVYEKQETRLADLQPSIDKSLFPEGFMMKVTCRTLAQSFIDTIVTTLTNIDKKESGIVNNKFAENSIQDTIEIFNLESNAINADHAFLRTITAFLSFYEGILKSCEQRMSYEFEKSIRNLSQEDIGKWQKEIENKFFSGARDKAAELKVKFKADNAVDIAINELWEFANNKEDIRLRSYNAVLARPPINPDKLEKVLRIKNKNNKKIILDENENEIDFEKALKERKLTNYIEKKKFLEKIVRFLTGDDLSDTKKEINYDLSNYTGYKEHVKKVIYPQIVTFAKHREDCDANDCLIMDHTGAFAEWHDGVVQILTEFKYIINNSYYAMPNLNRIETEWWVDPILISCYEFDEEVRKASADADVK